jgi:TetR/AcrR family transcriptional regulator
MHPPLVKRIEEVLLRGHKAGVFRANVDAVQLYVSIAALCYFYFSNTATLSAIFDRDLADAGAIRERQDHVTDVVMGYLRP